MRNRLSLAAMLVCLLALATTSGAYDRPYVIYDENVSVDGSNGTTLDDHPWGEDQSIANPNNGGTSTTNSVYRPQPSAIAKVDQFFLRVRLHFIEMFSRWTNTSTESGTTTGTVPTTNSATVSDGVQ